MQRHPFLAALTILASACGSDSGPSGQGATVRATIYGAESWGDVSGPLADVTVTIAGLNNMRSIA